MDTLIHGSKLFQPLADTIGFPVDQLNFFLCQIFAIFFGYIFRLLLPHSRVGLTARHVIEALIGFTLLFFCFGIQSFIVIAQSLVCWSLMFWLPQGLSEISIFIVAMSMMGVCHCFRMYNDYSGYTMDVTGPLMINTQRITSLGFSVADGKILKRNPNFRASQFVSKRTVINIPSLLELLSYTLSFHAIICGPFCFYNDYINFLKGTNATFKNEEGEMVTVELKPTSTVLRKLLTMLVFLILMTVCGPLLPVDALIDDAFIESNSFSLRFLYCIIATTVAKFKYYVAWKLAEAVNASAGLGFSGLDEDGDQKWDLIDNVDIMNVEFAISIRTLLNSWNSMTALWLRHVIYERTQSTLAVFAVSAYWHGFYPGYYFTFITAAFLVYESRLARQLIRPIFQTNHFLSMTYDLLTLCVTKVSLTYLVMPFLLLEFGKTLKFLGSFYYFLHVTTIAFFIVLLIFGSRKGTDNDNVAVGQQTKMSTTSMLK